ncbi:MAG: FecR domain-containing protein [Pontiellaceae bacterium]|nr:FecR domain-containing protein [Pontiellaceae bacterium]MBN2783697.1 FecR domain-containing protein [Pontiellaceae bacterium]
MKMKRKEKERQVLRWIGAMQDRDLTEPERSAMNAALSDDAEMRSIYLDLMHQESCLAASQGMAIPHNVVRARYRRTMPLLRLAACVAGALGIGYWVGNHPGAETPVATRSYVPPKEPLAVFLPSEDAQWTADMELTYGSSIGKETIELKAGRVRLDFFSGAVTEVEAPARFELCSDQHLHLYNGRAVSETRGTSASFKVTTAQSAFVDVGTMFAVNADNDQNTEMHVYEGEVIASALDEKQTTEREWSVTENQTLLIDRKSRQLKLKNDTGAVFAVLSQPELTPLPDIQEYAAAVKASRPDYYWTFENKDNGEWASEGALPLLLRNQGQKAEIRTQNGNTALYFPHRESFSALMADEDIFLDNDSAFTLELWVCPEKIHRSTVAGCYLLDSIRPGGGTDHLYLIETQAQAQARQHVAGAIRTLYRPLPSEFGGVNMFTETSYIPTRWMHMVYTRDAEQVCFYVNGVLEKKLPLVFGEELEPNQYRLAFCEMSSPENDSEDRRSKRPYVGMIDEIAFYSRVLSVDEVRSHYKTVASP